MGEFWEFLKETYTLQSLLIALVVCVGGTGIILLFVIGTSRLAERLNRWIHDT